MIYKHISIKNSWGEPRTPPQTLRKFIVLVLFILGNEHCILYHYSFGSSPALGFEISINIPVELI